MYENPETSICSMFPYKLMTHLATRKAHATLSHPMRARQV